MKFLKALTQKKLAKAVVCGLVLSGGMVVGMGQADAGAYITGAGSSPYGLAGTAGTEVKITAKGPAGKTNYYGETIYGVEELTFRKAISLGKVTMESGTDIGSIIGGASLVTANKNVVNISGGTIKYGVYGGDSLEGDGSNNNIVNISGGEFKDGWDIRIAGGNDYYSTSNNNNIVNISGGTINRDVYGVYSLGGAANNNSVNLIGEGGKLNVATDYDKEGNTIYSDVVNKGAISISKTVYGSYKNNGTGNTLNVAGKNTTVGNIASFQNLNFYVTQDMIGKSMLIVNAAENANTVLPAASGIKILAEDGVDSVTLKEGDKITLIDKQDAGKLVIGEEEAQPGKIEASIETKVIKSAVEDYEAEVRVGGDGNDLILTVGAGKNPGNDENKANIAKNMAETRAAGLAIVNEGVDFMVEHGMANAKVAVKEAAAAGDKGLAPFAAVGGGKMRYNSGSHIDSKSWHGAVGVAKEIGNMTIGFAVDHGKTSFDSYNDGGVKGSGDSKATGASVMAEVKKDNGVHFDGSIRAGRVKNDYSAMTSYDQSSTYYGLSLGGGKEFAVSDKNVVDVYGRYFWTHTNSSDATDNIGTKLEFDAINSHRVRVGGRFTHDVNDISKLYAGLAWQHEFKGDTRATVGGFEAPAPSLKGNTGIMELGWKVNANKNLDLDLGATGYTGKQKGASLNLALNFKF